MGLRTVARVSFTQAIIGSFRSLYPLLPVEGLGPLLSAGDFGPLLWAEAEFWPFLPGYSGRFVRAWR